MVRTRDCSVSRSTKYSLCHQCDIPFELKRRMLCIYCKLHRAILLQWKMNGERTLNNSCSQSLAARGIHKNLQVCFPNIPVQVEFLLGPNLSLLTVCCNISILHDRDTNHPKSKVHVHPSRFILYSSNVFVFASPLYLKRETIYTRCHLKVINVPSHVCIVYWIEVN